MFKKSCKEKKSTSIFKILHNEKKKKSINNKNKTKKIERKQ
jgi:hypothetical protein